jgi:DNA polymerase III subunit beta
MKTTLQRQEFLDALTAVSSLTSGRTPKPILACTKLSAHGEELELAATDGEAALRLRLSAMQIDRPGEAVVNADRLLSIVRELADVEITLQTDERHCVIRGQGSEFKIYMQSLADFPPVPDFDNEPDVVIEARELRRMIELTLYAAARETSRYAINGVLWDKQGKRLYMVATDGRRLARAGGQVQKSHSAAFSVIIPTKALSVFERVFTPPKDDEPWTVDLKVTPNQIILHSRNRILSSALVEGRFPKYEDVIPQESNRLAVVDRAEFHSAVKRAALLTTEDSRAVRLAFSQDQLVISSQSPEQGEARIEVPIEFKGEDVAIGFNPAFLSDALKVLPFEQVRIEMQEPFRPGVLTGEDKNDFLYVVMPVSLSS